MSTYYHTSCLVIYHISLIDQIEPCHQVADLEDGGARIHGSEAHEVPPEKLMGDPIGGFVLAPLSPKRKPSENDRKRMKDLRLEPSKGFESPF